MHYLAVMTTIETSYYGHRSILVGHCSRYLSSIHISVMSTDIDSQSPASYGHDSYIGKKSKSNVS